MVTTQTAYLKGENLKCPPQKSHPKLPTLMVKTLSVHVKGKTLNAHLNGQTLNAHLKAENL